jgi:hypothetical protein
LRRNEVAFWFSRSAWSLQAIAQLRQRVTGKTTVTAWFPGYFCNESLAPLRDLGACIRFYPLLHDGTADVDACRSMRDADPPDVVVAVHYFGQPAPLADLARFAGESGAWLIEDAAHVLRPTDGVGERGDFVLHSPHKLLPVPDGALLLIRDNGPGNVTAGALGSHDFHGVCASMVRRQWPILSATSPWLAKRLLQKAGVRSRRASALRFHEDDDVANAPAFPQPAMSTLAKRLLGALIGGLDAEASVRQRNRAEWCARLETQPMFRDRVKSLPATHAPYLAGFHHASAAVAEDVYERLRRAGVPVVTWPDLPPEVVAAPERQAVAISMRHTRIFLPVHRSVGPADIRSAVERVAR